MRYLLLPALAFTLFSCGGGSTEVKQTKSQKTQTPKTEKKVIKKSESTKKTSSLKSVDGQILAFYNVENLFDIYNDASTNDEQFLPKGENQWTEDRYDKKLTNIAKVVTALPKDLPVFLGMVEVENRKVIEDLISETNLKKGNYGISHFDSPDGRGIDNAMIYRKEYAKLLKNKAINIPLGNYKTRDILYSEFELNDGKRLFTFVNHWPSRREGKEATSFKREKAAKVLRSEVDRILKEDPNANIVIMGDFNDYPTDKSVKNVLKAGTDTRGLYNLAYDLQMNAAKTHIGSHSYRGTWGMLDQIIVSPNMLSKTGGFNISQEDFDVFFEDFLLFKHPKYGTYQPNRTYAGPKYIGKYSDHLPVYVEL